MKSTHTLITALFVASLIFIESCKSDEATPITYTLIVGNRTSGKFYSVNETTGATKEIFTPTYNGATLTEVRAVVYHPKKNLFYFAQNTEGLTTGNALGNLYSMNPTTKLSTLINDNSTSKLIYAIGNWSIAKDDSLIGLGLLRTGLGSSIVKFGTDGKQNLKPVTSNFCCGLGMLYDSKTNKFILSNDGGYKNKIYLKDLDAATGVLTNEKIITTFTGFPEDFSVSSSLSLKAMAQNGTNAPIYGLIFNGISTSKKTYLVKVDLTALTATYISTIGADNNNQYNNLTYAPSTSF
ncbi:MAG: hypothetical protein HOP30_01575 [Cyclobacteriaceae bacterium]|nr:hypothetical protein [Cyclobacteriaceae bacterium]